MISLFLVLVLFGAVAPRIFAEESQSVNTQTLACTFQDGTQLSVRYEPGKSADKRGLPLKQLWPPEKSPMYLFTQSEISVGNSDIPVGAYRMYVIPDKDNWTLVVNKDVSAGKAYNQQEDLLRAPMQVGQLGEASPTAKVVLGHIGPKQCNMRIYCGKTGAWAEFNQK